MTLAELKDALTEILSAEEQENVDWKAVDALCLAVVHRLSSEPAPEHPHDVVYHYLDDPDVRQKSVRYAQLQRERLKAWLKSANDE